MDKLKHLVQSRKFWALVASLASTYAMWLDRAETHVTGPMVLAAVVTAFSTFKIGTAIEGKQSAPQLPQVDK